MKRKITQIGKFLLAASLMLGSASWANAEKQAAPPVLKKVKKTVEYVWDMAHLSPTGDSLNLATAATASEGWKWSTDNPPRINNASPNTGNNTLKNLTAHDQVIEATKGLTFLQRNKEDSKSANWGEGNLVWRTASGASNCLRVGKPFRLTIEATDKYPLAGQTLTVRFCSASGSEARGINKLIENLEGDPVLTIKDTTVTYKIPKDGKVTFFSSTGIEIKQIKISGVELTEETAPMKVGYVGSPLSLKQEQPVATYYEPVYDALQKIKAKEGNNMEVEYIEATIDTKFSNDLSEKYDVLVVGSLISGDITADAPCPFYASLDSVIGTLPVLNTHAFWHNATRMNWAADKGVNPNDATYEVAPLLEYRDHPVFAGLVDPEKLESQKIAMFNYNEADGFKNYLQGYPGNLTESAPAHTTIAQGVAINGTTVNTIAESWSRACPYMLIGINTADLAKTKSKQADGHLLQEELTENAQTLIGNALNYLVNSLQQQPASILGTCPDPKITFEKVKAQGNDSDTLRYVLRIEVGKQHDVTLNKDTFPTVAVTIGSLAAKAYDFAHPDTLWEPCTVKAKATALLYDDSKEVTADFKNPYLRTLDTPEAVFTKYGETVRYVLTFKDIKATLDGVDTTAVIKYSLDGSDDLTRTYDKNNPDTVWENTRVKALASLYLHVSSAKLDSTWKNPDVQPAAKPVITSAQNEDYLGGCVMTVTITSATEGADIYYTFDGSEANRNSYHYTTPFDVENFEDVTIKAIAVKEYFSDSETAEEVIPANTEAAALATPVVAISDNSFTITCEATGKYDIIYTVDGSDPSTENGLIYTDKVTYLKGDYTIKAIAQGYGYKASAVSEGKEFKPADDKDHVFLKTMYKSTFNLNDPSAVKDPNTGAYTWGWFRWTPETPGGEDWSVGAKHTDSDRTEKVANKYITDQEWNDGVYYDSEKKPRVQIFENDAKTGWRHFNNWVFWKDGRKDGNSYRRILIQEGMSAKLAGALVDADSNYVATGGAIYIFNATPKAVVGPDSLLQGPFAVVVNIASGNNGLAYTDAATMNVCLASNSTEAGEIKIGEVSCTAGKMGTDTIYYYGDQKVYVRLTTESKIVLVYDFIAYKEGIDLSPLAIESIEPDGQMAPKDTAEIDADVNTFTVTFNHDIEPGAGKVQWTKGPTRKDCETSVSGNVLTVTLPADAPKEAGTTYGLLLQQNCVTDADGQSLKEGIYFYYTIKGADAIDEVSAAKEVVATHIYSISGAEIPALRPGINFVKKIYSDGSVTTEKVQVK